MMCPSMDLFGLMLSKFIPLLESVDSCLSLNLGSFQHNFNIFSALHFSPLLLGLWWHKCYTFFLVPQVLFTFFGYLFLSSDWLVLGILVSSFKFSICFFCIFYFFADTFYFIFYICFKNVCDCLFKHFFNSCFKAFVRSLQHLCYLIMCWMSVSMQVDIFMVLHLTSTFGLHWLAWIRLGFA